MMLNAFLPKIQLRYAFAGSAIGTLVPAMCFGVDTVLGGSGSLSVWVFQGHSEFALAMTPIWMFVLFLQIGRTRAALVRQIAMRRSREIQLIHNALYDRLTGLPNRLALENDLEGLLAGKQLLTLLLIDLNKFKFVNDTMGHDAGDELLTLLGKRMAPAIGHGRRMYRLGGDEFVVVLDGHLARPEIDAICSGIKKLAGVPFELKNGLATTGASIGVTFSEPGDLLMGTILKRADVALYKAKEIFGGGHVYFSSEMAMESRNRMGLERDLQGGLRNGEFFIEYQPIVGVDSRSVHAFEALLRWNHPTLGVIQPNDFISLAERTGMMSSIGNWVIRQACMEAAKWPSPTGVAINISGDQLSDRSFVDFVRHCLSDSRLEPVRLTLEIKEALFSIDSNKIRDSLVELRSMGVRIALDDFGSGFSSFSNLRHFPLDQIKVDRCFTQTMLGDHRDVELINIMMRLGSTFDVKTTIEGIETESQMDVVRALGAAEAQGFLFARPMGAGEITGFLSSLNEKMITTAKLSA